MLSHRDSSLGMPVEMIVRTLPCVRRTYLVGATSPCREGLLTEMVCLIPVFSLQYVR